MKTLLVVIIALIASLAADAQIRVANFRGYHLADDQQYHLDALILFDGIDGSTSVTIAGAGSVLWQYEVGGETFSSNQPGINPEDGILYTAIADGRRYHIYTIDYSLYPIVWQSLILADEQPDECSQLVLNASAAIPGLMYTDSTGATRQMLRECTLSWTDASWTGEAWADSAATFQVADIDMPITITAPRRSTTIALSGDQWAEPLGITPDSITLDYSAVRVESHPLASVVEREYLNEKDRSADTGVEGSGPLHVAVVSNANPLDVVYCEWKVANVETPDNYQRYNDPDLNYIFEETGEYIIRLTVSSDKCEYNDSINVRVTESYIEAPNVFTPNADGVNDEWRVAYRSIERYSCIIQNRWGRTVFKSDNPGKGWDGTIGGRPAPVGTYYYVIIAYGTDLDIKGNQKKYKLSGDINLLR